MHIKQALAMVFMGICALLLAYFFGIYSYYKQLWPISELRKVKNSLIHRPSDPWGRWIHVSQKVEVPCPLQTEKTEILLLLGQSNAGNHAEHDYISTHGDKVINYFGGRCFIAASPLLGTTGEGGEPWTLLGNTLISSGLAERVVLIPSAIAGSSIHRWKNQCDLNNLLLSVLTHIKSRYTITKIVWHQGEADFTQGTSQEEYTTRFYSLVDSLRLQGVEAPIYPSVTTKCGLRWNAENPIALAQQSLYDAEKKIYRGVNSDALLDENDRYDACHFSKSGQEKFAQAWFEIFQAKPD